MVGVLSSCGPARGGTHEYSNLPEVCQTVAQRRATHSQRLHRRELGEEFFHAMIPKNHREFEPLTLAFTLLYHAPPKMLVHDLGTNGIWRTGY